MSAIVYIICSCLHYVMLRVSDNSFHLDVMILLYLNITMKVKIESWHAVGTWKWDIENYECCTICLSPFESPCPRCKFPGDDCVPIQGECQHHFHLHCILKWT